MIIVWHEGALGDLLLARLAIRKIKKLHPGTPLILFARNEVRKLFEQARLVENSFPTSLQVLPSLASDVSKAYVFAASSSLEEVINSFLPVKPVFLPSRPFENRHLALTQVEGLFSQGGKKFKLASIKKDGLFLFGDSPIGSRILLHPGSGSPLKNLPLAFWRKLYEFLEDLGFAPLFLLGPAEIGLKKALSGFSCIFCEEVETLQGVMKKAFAFIGHDSGVSHLASALGLYTLAIFGPTPWRNWAPYGRAFVCAVKCDCVINGEDPRDCQAKCLKDFEFDEFVPVLWRFFNTIPRSYLPEKVLEHLRQAERPLEAVEGYQLIEEPWLEYLGLEVVEVAEARSP